ncbi:branched-chain amino acid ABC transporter ATP-binding protein [Candidatus Formimonas warabiya]|uniref:Branched-chain amino acid ABC transporter ATP-binding protein n=1 Tax=Formimonas warabiya TaxID=1761012 RepID=A0A3G1L2B1_FORW1|nr:branched-chain amino acid ABC transporter ATP-binding protein [Candidatus Formimonas warabiya]
MELKNVNVGYGYLQVIWDISFRINEGEVVAILGPNGAGKTTTLKTVMGILKPKSGKIHFNGKDITGTTTNELVKLGLVFVPEERNLFPAMTVLENLLMGAYTVKDKNKITQTLDYIYTLFPRLAERKKQLAGTMSGGERQMLAIARGLMSGPKMIMLDEPSMGLSPQNVLLVFETIAKLRKEKVTTLIVEQNVNTTLKVADRAYVMEQGRIAMAGSSAELSSNDHVRKMYLGIA